MTRAGVSSRLAHARANPLEYVLLMLAFVAIGVAMYETVAVALNGDRTQDLTFSGTTSELGRTLSSNGSARIGRLERATFVVAGDTVVTDTIVVVADSVTEPAFAAGGFLRDQVSQYNDFAIRQALLSAREARDGGRPARPRSEGRTLLRSVWADDGSRMLSDRPSPYGLAIRSPYAEGSWRDVRTTDWRSSPGLLGHDGRVRGKAYFTGSRVPFRSMMPSSTMSCGWRLLDWSRKARSPWLSISVS